MDKQLYNVICEFTSENSCFPINEINPTTELSKDIRIDGGDASEFMDDFSKKFNVDMSDFIFGDHFGSEGSFNPIYFIFCFLFNRKQIRLKPITIEHLTKCAEKGRWVNVEE